MSSLEPSSAMPLNSFVWLKQEGYPWWPGIVVDPSVAGQTMPPELGENGICVLCLPSDASTIAFANRSNPEEVLPFHGGVAVSDAAELARRAEGLAHPDCASAVEEALAKFQAALSFSSSVSADGSVAQRESKSKKRSAGDDQDDDDDDMALLSIEKNATTAAKASDSDDDDDDDDDLDLLVPRDDDDDKAAAKQKRRLERKKEKKEKKKNKKRSRHDKVEDDGMEEAGRHHHSKRGGGGARREGGPAAVKKSKQKNSSAAAGNEGRRGSDMDEEEEDYDANASAAEEAQRFFDAKYRTRRHAATNVELRQYAEGVKACIASLHENDKEHMSADLMAGLDEHALLEHLRQFAVCDVTAEQLQETGVGKTVGYLLRDTFPSRVRVMAHAILTFWFASLSNPVQEALMDTDVGNCSIESTRGSEDLRDEALLRLSAVGTQIFWCFQEEEIIESECPEENVYTLCEDLATEVQKSENMDVRLAVLHRIANEVPLRMKLLTGDLTPSELIQHEEDVTKGFGSPLLRRDGSPASPMDMASPTFGPSTLSQGGVATTLYACPSCGAKDAFRSGYSVSAHDNFPDILHCRRCGERWNIAS